VRCQGMATLVGGGILLSVLGCTSDRPAPDVDGVAPPAASDPRGSVSQNAVALVTHPSRGPIDIDLPTAHRVIDRAITNWRSVGQPPGPLTFRDEGSARQLIRAVANDPSAVALVPVRRIDPRVRAMAVDGVDPLTDPGGFPLQAEGKSPQSTRAERPITITVVGDIMMARGVAAAMGDDTFAPVRPVAPTLRSADVTIGTLESSLSQDGPPLQGGDSFGADPRILKALERAGVDVLSLANNHVGDYGTRALRQTVREVDASAIRSVGAGNSRAEARRPVVVQVKGIRIGVLAFNSIGESPAAGPATPGVAQLRMPPRTGPLDRGDLASMTRAVARLRAHADIVIVIPHWGEQYTSRPLPVQRQVGRRLVDAGATAVVGGHPHWVQGMELVGDSVIAYSLGNFVFDMDFSEQTMRGMALDLTFWGDRLMAVTPRPTQISPAFVTRFAKGERARAIEAEAWRNSFGSWAG
jgi:poly-gamma-glutamate capsule biosynthesis protein CapA/YwtB (metallophosphatase superfamily)